MNISSPQTPKPPDKKRILVLGPPGARKTTAVMSFPDICFFDIDIALDGPKQAIKKITGKEPTFGYESVAFNGKHERLDITEWYDNLLMQMADLKTSIKSGKCPYKFCCIDGLRNLGEMVKAKVMKDQSRNYMETRDWDPYKTKMMKVIFLNASDLGIHILFTCHVRGVYKQTGDKKDVMKEILIGYEPILQGGIQDGFSGFFTDVWHVATEQAPGGRSETKISTVKSELLPDLKASMPLPNEITYMDDELAWTKLEPYMKGIV